MARKKIKRAYPRRKATGFSAAPTNSFIAYMDYIRLDLDRKDLVAKIKIYIKQNCSKADQKIMLAAPEWAFVYNRGLAATIFWDEIGKEFPAKWDKEKVYRERLAYIKEKGQEVLDEKKKETKKVYTKSPAEIAKDRISDFIAGVEEVLDSKKWDKYSVYNELLKVNGSQVMANAVAAYYAPARDEFQELVDKKTADLVEAYGYLSVQARKKYLKFLTTLVADAERYALTKKATRAPRRIKTKSAVKQTEKIQYLKQSDEYKIASIHPELIVGAERVLLFNTKTRVLTELVNEKPGGFEVRGTTIYGLDSARSRATKLRKPHDFLPIVMTKTPLQYNKEWKKLTTKDQAAKGRINSDTIILRALNK